MYKEYGEFNPDQQHSMCSWPTQENPDISYDPPSLQVVISEHRAGSNKRVLPKKTKQK